MCGRCLSEGRSIHDNKKVVEDESGYELKIYPGYCTLNPNYAAQQMIIRKKSNKIQQSGVDLSTIGITKTAEDTSPSMEQVRQELDTNLIPTQNLPSNQTQSTEVKASTIQSSMTIAQENMKAIPVANPLSRSFRVSNLFVFVFDENMSNFPNLLKKWACSILGDNTIVQFASSEDIENNKQTRQNWTVDTIHEGIIQYIDGFCSNLETRDQITSELQNVQHLSLYFTSLSKQLNNAYDVEAYLRLQRKLSAGITLKSLALLGKPNFQFSLLAINHLWQRIKKGVFFRCLHSQLSFNGSIPPVVVIFFQKSDPTTSCDTESSMWKAIRRPLDWGLFYLQLLWAECSLYAGNIIPR